VKQKKTLKPLFVFSICLLLVIPLTPKVLADINCQWLVNQTPDKSPDERYKKGYCLIQLGRFEEGVALLRRLQKELPIISDYVLYYIGVGEKEQGKLEEAEKTLSTLLANYPETGVRKRALIKLSEVYYEKGEYEKARNILMTLYSDEVDPLSKSNFLNRIGETFEKQNRFREALKVYKELWVEFPESVYAEEAFKKALQISKAQSIPFKLDESDYLKRAEKLFKLSKWELALGEFEKVSKTEEVRLKIAISKFYLGRFEEALKTLSQINSADSLYWRARINLKLGKDREAAELYYRIYLLYPKSRLVAQALYNAARLYQINSDLKNAIELYDLLIRTYPESEFTEDAAWNLGWIHYRMGNYREALATFSAFEFPRTKYWRAKTLEKMGKKKEALSIYEAISRKAFPSYYSYLAQLKTGARPTIGPIEDSREFSNPTISKNLQKAEFLIRLGISEDASLEIKKLEEKAKNTSELLATSMLYSKIGDFYNSIRIAERIDGPEALKLSYPLGFREIVSGFSSKHKVDEFMIYSIIREESRFQKNAVSRAGAIGLMQLLPTTAEAMAKEVEIERYTTDMLYVPRINIELGIAYLRKVLNQFNGNICLALASYNAGPYNVVRWLNRFSELEFDEFVEEIPFQETRNYIKRVLRSYGVYKTVYDSNVL